MLIFASTDLFHDDFMPLIISPQAQIENKKRDQQSFDHLKTHDFNKLGFIDNHSEFSQLP
ncbi:hypothetical protein B4W72_06720 [Staphylococcus delphini]|uniref:Uncharacterized protein n=1 Tax=Staphylococcus delphini TaxID=53344 RepID=A0A2A4GYG7_9STAP|nr:hypothetical protein B5C08_04715 [Staphylococcus delphini]PCF63501.1 hypothetical protein B5C01_01230 [Staphylococcus delphini]PCF73001.1 hypothetical protein B4W72_06720 [Staphylococcus delphini]